MEVWGLVGFLLIAFALTSMVMGVAAFVQTRELKAEIRALKLQIGPQSREQSTPESARQPPASSNEVSDTADLTLDLDLDPLPQAKPVDRTAPERVEVVAPASWLDSLVASARTHWMIWLGGACVGLAGIFLARYAVEQGVLGPAARVSAGLLTGLVLHLIALWLRFKRGAHASFAALAGGASITLFAVLLAALHWYQMFSVPVVFVLLALVAIATLWLALLHGPLLAAIGMLGAYSVPALVSTGSGAIHVALVYSLIILVMVLSLYRRVPRDWLWWGAIAGAAFWWLVSLDYPLVNGWRGFYLALIGLAAVFVGTLDWKAPFQRYWPGPQWYSDKLGLTLALLLLAVTLSSFAEGWYNQFANTLAVPILVLALCGFRRDWGPLVLLAIASVWLPWLLSHGYWDGSRWQLAPLVEPLLVDLQWHLVFSLLLFFSLSAFGLYRYRNCQWRAGTTLMAPLAALSIGYWLLSSHMPTWQWALLALGIGCLYLGLAPRLLASLRVVALWLFIAGHFGIGVAAAMLLAESGLTLAFAVMMVSVAWVIRRFDAPELAWVFKSLVMLVTVRLSVNPFVVFYDSAPEWLLFSFGLATVACFAASKLLSVLQDMRRWSGIATMHLAMLSIWLLARYCLNGGDPFATRFSAEECVVNLWLFGAMACLYERKASLDSALKRWYSVYSRLQLAIAALHYVVLVLAALDSTAWLVDAISARPVFNLLMPALGAPVALLLLARKLRVVPAAQWPWVTAALSLFLTINFEIRHLWQGSISLIPSTGNGELYTYSIVWLLVAMGLMFGIVWHRQSIVYRTGMVLLVLVIGKIFLWDMAGLEGLWRVASFMGLGLALLALGYLHQRLSEFVQAPDNN